MKAIRVLSLAALALVLTLSYASADWPMWGGTPSRNMVSGEKGVSINFDLKAGKDGNVLWQQGLGSQTYGNPIVADGKVFVGTNNGGGWRKISECFSVFQKPMESSCGSYPVKNWRLVALTIGCFRGFARFQLLRATACGWSPIDAN